MEAKLSIILGVVAAVPFGSLSTTAVAGTAEAQQYAIWTRQQAESLKPGTSVAMTCAKCKTVLVMKADKKKTFLAWFTPETRHACPGCGGYITIQPAGGGKASAARLVHTCSKCGDNSAFCCCVAPMQM